MPLLLFPVVRMAVRAAVLAALIATVLSTASSIAGEASWETIEAGAAEVLGWLSGLFDRIAGLDLRMSDIRLGELQSASDWFGAVQSVFAGETPAVPTDGLTSELPVGDLPFQPPSIEAPSIEDVSLGDLPFAAPSIEDVPLP